MDWEESRQEELDGNLLDYLLSSKRFLEDFVCYIEDQEPKLLEKLLDAWINTPDGKKWYDSTLEAMIYNVPENDEREDR